mmetsp:Transcript_1354/g.1838  ORF Transcript_1354/g.1838 Transcript_1354/m.1838 type:complete len:207 (-) Transcript_1354:260-880(-)|eukprot:CAMPEP_0179420504 /NCGR_PEP_ID=MMETSP0799-20121207/9208_1 /TAXON_ID=46947 /ORGANISM="Geminigera cryophila, Strain CCMP2564" /LENGTH=206 /DNA_ID=CAMNT_0021194129 /DNA_START=86 /DNA_END=706 /DNA_ORIENTATION=-
MAAKKMVSAGLNSVTGRLFPETRELLDEEEEMTGELTITNTEIASSLSLQMLLYFNVQYSLFWGLITLSLMVFSENYLEVNTAYRVLSPLLLSVWFMVEPLRLFFGYVGNLQEKVPQLTGFWLLTLIPQLPITFFFIVALPLRVNKTSIQLPFQRAGSIILMCFVFVEAVVGYYALRRMVKSQVLKFHMQRARDEASASTAGGVAT